jgi:hypothetical protein
MADKKHGIRVSPEELQFEMVSGHAVEDHGEVVEIKTARPHLVKSSLLEFYRVTFPSKDVKKKYERVLHADGVVIYYPLE